MKSVGSLFRLVLVAAIVATAALGAAGCGDDDKKDTTSVDQSAPAQSDSGETKQFKSGEEVGKSKKVVVESDAEFSAEQRAVITRMGEFADATDSRDYKKLCNDMLSSAVRKIGGDCEKTFAKSGEQIKDFKIAVSSVTVAKDGKTALAKVSVSANGDNPSPQEISMIKEDGKWRVQILGQ